MFEVFFFVPVLIVAGVWGYFLFNIAGNNRRFLRDDVLSANEKQRKEAKRTLRTIHLMTPVWAMPVAAAILFLVNAFHPFLRFSIPGVALIAGGVFFTYLGWALGMIFRGTKDEPGNKDAMLCSRVFMISFMGAGLLVTAIGVIVCSPSLAALFP